jgi:initiation factor 1A
MPPNAKGGKHFKKNAKHSGDSSVTALMIERQADQQIARVIRVLGNRNMLCYCNDNQVRICHVRGKMRNRVYVGVGDIVLVSFRDFADGAAASATERGDILAKYPSECLTKLKKEDGMNQRLFMQLETMDGTKLGAIGVAPATEEGLEDGFEFDRDGDGDGDAAAKSDSEEGELDIDAI